ncbi:MAG: GAF domain-containing protein [Verrucomicrobia bacterium]|nr:GAF domain-containing protein [Verrucomicrobiota bacterium]
MIDQDEATELATANDALRRSLASLTNAEDLWSFVIGTLTESAQAIAASSAAIFLFDERSNHLRTAIVLEDGRPVDFFKEDRFTELREPFEVGHSIVWQELVTSKNYQWRDLTDDSKLSFKWLIPWYRRLGLTGGLAVPLIFNARPIGLAVYGCRNSEPPPRSRLELLKNLIHEAAVAIQVLRINHRARDAEIAHKEVRAAGEVHESVAQSLAAISMHLAGAQSCLESNPAKASRAIGKARELARLGIELVRRTTLVLRAAPSGENGTSQRLIDFIRDAGRESGLVCDFREIGQVPQTIGAETEKGLLQISREAVNNALQHGRPQRLEAVLTWYADRVKLEIADDGVGFDLNTSEQHGEGYGIKGMRECAAIRGGTLDIVSGSGHGTRVSVTLPILNV